MNTGTKPLPEGMDAIKQSDLTLMVAKGREILWANTVGEKRDLVANNKGPFFVAWTGRYKTDIFTWSPS